MNPAYRRWWAVAGGPMGAWFVWNYLHITG
jgi:uncharacterized membrane protein YdcZ (DUF606 family)